MVRWAIDLLSSDRSRSDWTRIRGLYHHCQFVIIFVLILYHHYKRWLNACDLTIYVAPSKDLMLPFILVDGWVEVLGMAWVPSNWQCIDRCCIVLMDSFSCSTNTSAAASGSGCSSNHSRTTSVSHPLPHQPTSGDQWNDALYALQSVSQTI